MGTISFIGKCFKVELKPRGVNDNHVAISVYTEDDENWIEGINIFSNFWLPELIYLLDQAQKYMVNNCIELDNDYGYSFKNKNENQRIN